MKAKRSPFALFAAGTLVYSILVILWGAYVRATGSGAGCGEHWPLCNGTILQRSPRLETLIELSHRLSSGFSLVLVVGLVVWAFRAFPKGHAVRQGAVLSLVLLLVEAALGAGLVLLKLVAKDASALRAVSVGLHLANTFLLLMALTYVAWSALLGTGERFRIRAERRRTALIGAGLVLLATVGISGAIVALGDTLFPAATLAEGLREDLSPTAHFLVRLRFVHPVLAVSTALLLWYAAVDIQGRDARPVTAKLSRLLIALVVTQISLGVLNMGLLAPVWLQLVHLGVADLTWVTLVTLGLYTLPLPGRDGGVLAASPSSATSRAMNAR